jgi:hypothetical protein
MCDLAFLKFVEGHQQLRPEPVGAQGLSKGVINCALSLSKGISGCLPLSL